SHICYIFCLILFFESLAHRRHLHSFPTRRSSDLIFVFLLSYSEPEVYLIDKYCCGERYRRNTYKLDKPIFRKKPVQTCCSCNSRSEEHTSELQSRFDLVCRLLLEKKNTKIV